MDAPEGNREQCWNSANLRGVLFLFVCFPRWLTSRWMVVASRRPGTSSLFGDITQFLCPPCCVKIYVQRVYEFLRVCAFVTPRTRGGRGHVRAWLARMICCETLPKVQCMNYLCPAPPRPDSSVFTEAQTTAEDS